MIFQPVGLFRAPVVGIYFLRFSVVVHLLQNANKAVKNEPIVAPSESVEHPASAHSDPEEPVSPAQVLSQSRVKARQKTPKSTKAHKAPKPPKMPKAPKTPKVKEGGKKKAKKFKETSLPLKASSFAALESHAKDILSKMDDSKKAKVGGKKKPSELGDAISAAGLVLMLRLLFPGCQKSPEHVGKGDTKTE